MTWESIRDAQIDARYQALQEEYEKWNSGKPINTYAPGHIEKLMKEPFDNERKEKMTKEECMSALETMREKHETLEIMLDKGAYMPVREHEWDAGADLKAPVFTVVPAHGEAHIDFGVHIAIPEGWYGRIESKSGLNFKSQLDTPGGIIDSGFTGSIKCVIENRGDTEHVFNPGDKVVQLVISPCMTCNFKKTDHLEETERGNSGFGSTGV